QHQQPIIPTTTNNYNNNHVLLQVLQEPDRLGHSLCQRHSRPIASLIHAGFQTQGPAQDDCRSGARDGHEEIRCHFPPASFDV
ncbi:hypothetical protein CPB97_001762, partial [Podila verticillata]